MFDADLYLDQYHATLKDGFQDILDTPTLIQITETVCVKMTSRIIQLDGVLNARDIGGYTTKDGRTTRWGRFFRAASLQHLTDTGQRTLLEMGLKTIIDLRRPDEATADYEAISAVPDISYFNLPILQTPVSSPTDHPLRNITSLAQVYVGMLDFYQPRLKSVFEHLAQGADSPTLIHCTAGKDRTGVVLALLLDLVNVPAETIIDDYAMTKALVAPMLDALRQKAILTGLDLDRHERMLACEPELMATMLDHLYATYGSTDSYLRQIGVSEVDISRLQNALLA